MRLDETEAMRLLTGRLPRFLQPPLSRTALIEVPYRIYSFVTRSGKRQYLAFDMFSGTLDPYSLDASTEFEESRATERNHLPIGLSKEDIRQSAEVRFQRVRFQEGFFRNRDRVATLESDHLDIFVPYWLGFFGARTPKLVVLDAVRKTREGSRLRHVLTDWLASPVAPSVVPLQKNS